MTKRAVTVLGLGVMGHAMANAFLTIGHPVTVWNRTASKADDLVAKGAARAATVDEAVRASELVVLSLTDYDAMYVVLEPVSEAMPGRVIANLSAGTPDQARSAAKWAEERGAQWLTGGPRVPPYGIGQPDTVTFYSGAKAVFDVHLDTLQALTGTDYRGEDPGLAMVYYQLEEDMLWTSLVGYLHSLAVARANGISERDFRAYAERTIASLKELVAFFGPRIDADEHSGDMDRVDTGVANMEHILRTSEEAGVDVAVPSALLDIFERAVAQGYAENSATSLIKVLANGAASRVTASA